MKINVHLALDPDTALWVRDINQRIKNITTSIVDFQPPSTMVPHISLAMGNISPGHSLDSVISTTEQLVGSGPTQVEPCRFTSTYLEDVRGRYVFADIEPSAEFGKVKDRFTAALMHGVLTAESEYTEKPHVTLGHVEAKQAEVRKLLTLITIPRMCGFSGIGIGEVGPKGTVRSVIKTWAW